MTAVDGSADKTDVQVNPAVYRKSSGIELLKPANGERYIFFTGKGGRGQKHYRQHYALYLADNGYKTLIVTTDPASHLHDIFGQEINHEPSQINDIDNLFAARIDQRQALGRIQRANSGNRQGPERRNEKIRGGRFEFPMRRRDGRFEKFMSYFEGSDYDITVFDTAPTGHTLRLLELPTDWKGFIDLGTLTKQTSEATQNKYGRRHRKKCATAKGAPCFCHVSRVHAHRRSMAGRRRPQDASRHRNGDGGRQLYFTQ